MYKQVLNSIHDVEIYPIVTLVIFIVFFASMIISVMRMDKETVSHASTLPLDPEDPS
jgi:hypothetical protein